MKFHGNIQTNANNEIASYYTDSGSANAYAVSMRPDITAYTAGLRVLFKATNTNTGSSTLNVNGIGAISIKKQVSSDLSAGDISSGQIVSVIYDGTNFQMLGNSGNFIWNQNSVKQTANFWISGLGNFSADGLGATQSDTNGILLINNTASTAGANAQYSPQIRFRGTGYKATAPSGSRPSDARIYLQTVTFTGTPINRLNFDMSHNNGAYSTVCIMDSTGKVTASILGCSNFITTVPIASNAGGWYAKSTITNNNFTIQTTLASQSAGAYFKIGVGSASLETFSLPVDSYFINEIHCTTSVTTAASGTHFLGATIGFKPLEILSGGATMTNSAVIYIENAATGATNNYSLWIDDGLTRLDGELELQGIPAETKDNVLYFDTTTKRVSYGATPSGGGGSITADNGLTANTSTNIQLGSDTQGNTFSPLLHDTYINTSTNRLTISGEKDRMLWVESSSGRTAYFVGNDGNTVLTIINASAGTGISAESDDGGVGGVFATYSPSSANSVLPALQIIRDASGSGSNGIGVSMQFLAKTSTSSNILSNELISKWTNATHATRTSQFIITGVNAGTTGDILTLNGNKSIKANGYGAGTFTGTATYGLAVDSSGSIIEVALGGSSITANNGLNMSTSTNVQLGGALIQNTTLSGTYNLAVSQGTMTIATTTPVSGASLTIDRTTSGYGLFAKGEGFPTTISHVPIQGQRIVSGGGGSYNGVGFVVGIYGELGFVGGAFTFSGTTNYTSLAGINGVVTMYSGTTNLTAGNSMFTGGSYYLNVSGSGTVDKFASIRALYPIGVPSTSWTGTITNYYGVYIDDLKGSINGSTITNAYGVYQAGSGDVNILNSPTSFGHTGTPSSAIDISRTNGYQQLRLRTSYTPSATGDGNGNTGQIVWDDNYVYVKTSAGWKRSALSTF